MPSAGTVCHNLLGGFRRRIFQSVFSSNTVVVVIPSVSSSMQFCKGTFLSSQTSWSSSSSSRMMVIFRVLLSSGAQHSREKKWNQASSQKYNKRQNPSLQAKGEKWYWSSCLPYSWTRSMTCCQAHRDVSSKMALNISDVWRLLPNSYCTCPSYYLPAKPSQLSLHLCTKCTHHMSSLTVLERKRVLSELRWS